MSNTIMNIEDANNILSRHDLPGASSLTKVEVGFTNEVYSLDDRHILKVCKDTNNEIPFKREALLYNHFRHTLPVPQLIAYDDSKSVYPKNYMIYPKIDGENLYNIWHTLSDQQRRDLVKQLCNMLQTISQTTLDDLPDGLALEPVPSWRDYMLAKIDKYLGIVEKAGTLNTKEADTVRSFVDKHKSALDDQKIALVYWDAHFDNILVKGDKIVGLLDFERTELASIDFTLDIVKRMVDEPKKYMSAYAEQFAKAEDYARLLDWYKEFYPELFNFDNLETRLDLYAIAHNLEGLENWPEVESLKENTLKIAKIV